jgi:hypothetical protein
MARKSAPEIWPQKFTKGAKNKTAEFAGLCSVFSAFFRGKKDWNRSRMFSRKNSQKAQKEMHRSVPALICVLYVPSWLKLQG